MRTLFDYPSALQKIGRRIQTTRAFSGIPAGTTGLVIRADRSGEGYTLAIQWNLPGRERNPLVDWFTKSEYERFLREM